MCYDVMEAKRSGLSRNFFIARKKLKNIVVHYKDLVIFVATYKTNLQ